MINKYIDFFSELPITFTKLLSNLEVVEKQEAVFECEVSKPNQPAKWLCNGQEIPESDRVKATCDGHKHSLTLSPTQLTDGAEYTCVVADKSTSGQLIVTGE